MTLRTLSFFQRQSIYLLKFRKIIFIDLLLI